MTSSAVSAALGEWENAIRAAAAARNRLLGASDAEYQFAVAVERRALSRLQASMDDYFHELKGFQVWKQRELRQAWERFNAEKLKAEIAALDEEHNLISKLILEQRKLKPVADREERLKDAKIDRRPESRNLRGTEHDGPEIELNPLM